MSGEVLSTGVKLIKQPVELEFPLSVVSGTRGVPNNTENWPYQVTSYSIRATSEVIGVPVGAKVKIFSNKPLSVVNGTKYRADHLDTGWLADNYYEFTANYQLLICVFKNEDDSDIDPAEVIAKIVITK